MKKTRYTEEQIAFALKQAETGTRVGDVCRKTGISEATFYIYGLPSFCKHWFWSWVIAYIYPASEKTCVQMGNRHTITSTTGRS